MVGADGEKLGELVAVQEERLLVAKGFFFTTDYHVPFSAVASTDGDVITLNVTTEEALDQGWESGAEGERPPVGDSRAPGSTSGMP